jgi:hypothetical protein
MYKIKNQNKLGMNGACYACGKVQAGSKAQPIALWFKKEEEKRGHNCPFCCIECAKQYIKDNDIK